MEQCGACQCLTGFELLHIVFGSGAKWSILDQLLCHTGPSRDYFIEGCAWQSLSRHRNFTTVSFCKTPQDPAQCKLEDHDTIKRN